MGSHTKTTAAHVTVTAAIARTPTLRVRWLYRGSLHLRLRCRLCQGLPRVSCRSRLCDLSCLQCNTRTSDFPNDVRDTVYLDVKWNNPGLRNMAQSTVWVTC